MLALLSITKMQCSHSMRVIKKNQFAPNGLHVHLSHLSLWCVDVRPFESGASVTHTPGRATARPAVVEQQQHDRHRLGSAFS